VIQSSDCDTRDCANVDSSGTVLNVTVLDEEACARWLVSDVKVDSLLREILDVAILNVDRIRSKNTDTLQSSTPAHSPASSSAVDRDMTYRHSPFRVIASYRYVDNDSIGPAGQNRGNAATVNSDRLGNGDSAEATWIEGIDFAADKSLGDCARESLAGSRAAARVDIIADARYPRARRLRL